jgi:endonuclease G
LKSALCGNSAIAAEGFCDIIVNHYLLLKASVLCLAIFVGFSANAIDNDPSLQMQLGNPSGAISDTNFPNNYLIQRTIEAISYNNSRGQPNWASWDLTSADANNAVVRQDSYSADTNLPPTFYQVGAGEYGGSGFDRGHLCPSADRTDSTNDNNLTFLMSNMMPQAADNNRVTWSDFEDYCRNLADAGNEMLIMCGPSGFNGSHISSSTHVSIPSNTWKIAVVVPLGPGTALSRITTTTNRVIAIKVPNTNGVSPNWSNYIVSAHSIELETGFSFFTALPGTIASAFRAKIYNLTNPGPPSITGFTPGAGLVNTNVVITGTNFLGTLSVKFNGTNAVFAVDSNTQITTTVPTNATTGPISVTTPAGTATSGANFAITATGMPDLAVTTSHSAGFMQGDVGRTISIVVTNAGDGISGGTVTVSNSLPAGLTATAISGSGWTTSLGTLTATRSDALGVGLTYPVLTITVDVANNAPVAVTNIDLVSGGGETNLANNTANEVIDINVFTNTAAIVTLAGWDVSALTNQNYGPSPFSATTNAAGVTVVGLTRGIGVVTNASGAFRAWGGLAFTNATSANAIGSNQFVTFGVAPQSGYKVSFTNINRFDYRRSGTGPPNGLVQYQLNGGAFVDIATVSYTNSTTSGSSIGPVDLSGIAALQNVGFGTNVTFRIVNWGGGSAGTWYIFDVANNSAPDLVVQGTVTAESVPDLPYHILSLVVSNQVGAFTWESASGRQYTVQSSADLLTWSNFIGPITATGTNVNYTTNVPVGAQFFRIYRSP